MLTLDSQNLFAIFCSHAVRSCTTEWPSRKRPTLAFLPDLQPAHLSFSAFDVKTIEFMLGCAPLPCVRRDPRNEAQLGKIETRNFPCCPPRGPKPQRRLFLGHSVHFSLAYFKRLGSTGVRSGAARHPKTWQPRRRRKGETQLFGSPTCQGLTTR